MIEATFYIILGVILLIWIFKKRTPNYHSHWNTLIPNFTYSSEDFYKQLEQELSSHSIDGLEIWRVRLREGGIASSKRVYLRVSWNNFEYDMCCAPFGDGLFLSWWLTYTSSDYAQYMSRIPMIGNRLARAFFPTTYYMMDSASMFMRYCHTSVLSVAEMITKDTGTRIDLQERKPILKDIFKR